MSEASEQSRSGWQQLEHEWSETQETWRDTTTEYFRSYYWEPLQSATEAYQQALEHLMEMLEAAQEAVGGW